MSPLDMSCPSYPARVGGKAAFLWLLARDKDRMLPTNLVQTLASTIFRCAENETGFFRFGGVDGVLEVLRALRAHNAASLLEMA